MIRQKMTIMLSLHHYREGKKSCGTPHHRHKAGHHQLGQLNRQQAAVMMELCRQYPVKYGLYDVDGRCLEAPENPVDLVRRRQEEEEEEEEPEGKIPFG